MAMLLRARHNAAIVNSAYACMKTSVWRLRNPLIAPASLRGVVDMRRPLCRVLPGNLAVIAAAVCVLLLVPAPASARAVSLTLPRAPSGHVTVLVLDVSGSMQQNDPAGPRCSAAHSAINLSRAGGFNGGVARGHSTAGRWPP